MPNLMRGAAITEFFRHGFQHTAWRLESRRLYEVDYESGTYQRFLRGEDPGTEGRTPWLDAMREQTAQGKRVERVRLFDDPLTTYQQFTFQGARHNAEAGEDIRYLARHDADELGLPEVDFWLFDSRAVGMMRYEGDRSLGMELVDDAAEVIRCCQVRDAAWHYAIPYLEFAARVRSPV
jgi:hypothetical protein